MHAKTKKRLAVGAVLAGVAILVAGMGLNAVVMPERVGLVPVGMVDRGPMMVGVRVWLEPGQTRQISLPCGDQTGTYEDGRTWWVSSDALGFDLEIHLRGTDATTNDGAPVESVEWRDSPNRTDRNGLRVGAEGPLAGEYVIVEHVAWCKGIDPARFSYQTFATAFHRFDGTVLNGFTTLAVNKTAGSIWTDLVGYSPTQCPLPPCL